MTKHLLKTLLTLAATSALLTGCATSPGMPSDGAATLASGNPQNLNRYARIALDKVDTAEASDGHWKGVSEARRANAVSLVHDSFTKAVAQQQSQSTPQADDIILNLRLTIEDVQLSSTVRSVLNHVVPIGLVANAGVSAVGGSGSRTMGSITIGGELRDARTNALVASFWSQESPDPMNLSAVVNQDSAMKAAIERSAVNFTAALAKARKGETDCVAGSQGDCRFKLLVVATEPL